MADKPSGLIAPSEQIIRSNSSFGILLKSGIETGAWCKPYMRQVYYCPYLGCVFTQHQTDEEGRPVRDHQSTSYVSSFKPIDEFGRMLRQEALRRGMGSADQVVLLIDGAAALENLGRDSFQDPVWFVALFHSLEQTSPPLGAQHGHNQPEPKARL